MSQPPLDLLTSRFADIQLYSGRALPVPASCTLASSCSSFDIDRLPSVCSPVLPQFMWRFNLIYESGEKKEMKADPGEDKHCLIRPLPYHPPWMPWSQGGCSVWFPQIRRVQGNPGVQGPQLHLPSTTPRRRVPLVPSQHPVFGIGDLVRLKNCLWNVRDFHN